MSEASPLAGFSGRARLFPLPNLVFFPHVMQPLHIFEPRYRQMTTDALEGDRFIAMVLPQPGWEKSYGGKPDLHSIGCLGQIVADQKLDDGRFNILLRGQARIRIIEEIICNKLYRVARTEILQECPIANRRLERRWRKTLIGKAGQWFASQPPVADQIGKLLATDLPLGSLCDIITFALPLEAEFKQELLEEVDVEARLKRLRTFLDAQQPTARRFPPEFSVN